jgi:hypothetical protein
MAAATGTTTIQRTVALETVMERIKQERPPYLYFPRIYCKDTNMAEV